MTPTSATRPPSSLTRPPASRERSGAHAQQNAVTDDAAADPAGERADATACCSPSPTTAAVFCGFARQRSRRTVAGELDGAVRAIAPRASFVRGASRTDSGVHARGQRVAFDVDRELPARAWVHSLNRELPAEINVRRAAVVDPGLRAALRRAPEKLYRYVILESVVAESVSASEEAWRVHQRLNHALMQQAALPLVGEHDFRAFRAADDQRENTVRHLLRIEVRSGSRDDLAS